MIVILSAAKNPFGRSHPPQWLARPIGFFAPLRMTTRFIFIMRSVAVLFLLLSAAHAAAPLDRDLGQGLTYFRLHELPGDLPTSESARKQPCVLDLRYLQGDASVATALQAWLKFHATARTPVLLLANAETSTALIASLSPRDPRSSVIVIGAVAKDFHPDIAVAVSADDERRAYDALDQNVPLASLLTDNPNKPRNDEARLAKEHSPEPLPPISDELIDDTFAPTSEKPPAPKPPAPLIDAVLQRAVHLHRALVALKKL